MSSAPSFGQFEEWELEAFVDGGNFPHIQEFVEQHPDLWSAWLHEYEKQQTLYHALRRFDCPTPDELRDYYWRFLPETRQAEVAAHLQSCLSCASEFQSLETHLAPEQVAVGESDISQSDSPSALAQLREQIEAFVEGVRWTVATLVTPPLSMAASAALRSDTVVPQIDSSRPTTLLFETEDWDINLVIRKEPDKTISLHGQLLAATTITEGEVRISSQDSIVPSMQVSLTDLGEFSFSGLTPGKYQIFLSAAKLVVAIPNLVLE